MILSYKEIIYVDEVPVGSECIIGADIGGTNSNFGIFTYSNGKYRLIISLHFKSKQIVSFSSVVHDILSYLKKKYAIRIKKAVFACAGIASKNHDFTKPTNLDFAIDSRDILEKTDLEYAFVVNDFEVIGYGLGEISPRDLVSVNSGKEQQRANKAIVGAGTGLGKTILIWDEDGGRYRASASEGGHADFAAQSQLELDLISFITSSEKKSNAISWEDLLSGDGIRRIYTFFCQRNGKENGEIAPHPDEIFNSRTKDKNSWDTFALYTTIYARCAKNFALEALALGGVYIAGGIAAKNLPLFEMHSFMDEFVNCGKLHNLLESIPIWVIVDYNVSLYGSAAYLLLESPV